MFNKYLLDSDTLQNLNKRRELRKKLAKKMLNETKFTKFTKSVVFICFLLIAFYFIHHDLVHGHFIHLYLHG